MADLHWHSFSYRLLKGLAELGVANSLLFRAALANYDMNHHTAHKDQS
jgi:hypothetical protein